MNRNKRRKAVEAKRTIPEFTDLTAADLELAQRFAGPSYPLDSIAHSDEQALRLQVQANRRDPHCDGVY